MTVLRHIPFLIFSVKLNKFLNIRLNFEPYVILEIESEVYACIHECMKTFYKGIYVIIGMHLLDLQYCYKTRIEWKIHSLIRRKKNRDILRYDINSSCIISIYCDTPSYIPYYVNFRFNSGPDCMLLGVILKQLGFFFAEVFFVMHAGGCVNDFFTEIKKMKTVFNFLYSVSYKSYASQFWHLVCKQARIQVLGIQGRNSRTARRSPVRSRADIIS